MRGPAFIIGLMLAVGAQPVFAQSHAAINAAPTEMVTTPANNQSDLCLGVVGGGYGSALVSLNMAWPVTDKTCVMIRKAKELCDGLGYCAAATQLLCQDKPIALAMRRAGTPCEAQVRGTSP